MGHPSAGKGVAVGGPGPHWTNSPLSTDVSGRLVTALNPFEGFGDHEGPNHSGVGMSPSVTPVGTVSSCGKIVPVNVACGPFTSPSVPTGSSPPVPINDTGSGLSNVYHLPLKVSAKLVNTPCVLGCTPRLVPHATAPATTHSAACGNWLCTVTRSTVAVPRA